MLRPFHVALGVTLNDCSGFVPVTAQHTFVPNGVPIVHAWIAVSVVTVLLKTI
jgi:hypothetical protein